MLDESEWNQYQFPSIEAYRKIKGDTTRPQDRAFAFADSHGGLPVFAKGIGTCNYEYLTTGWNTFYHMYKGIRAEDRIYTELIREKSPVHFYADLDLYRITNPEYTPGSEKEAELLVLARKSMLEALLRCFPHLKEEEIERIELDSSNETKLSRHLLWRIKGKALATYETARAVYDDIVQHTPVSSPLWVVDHKDINKRVHFIDCNVYSKNRQFRIYQSRKFDSYRFLRFPKTDDEEQFWDNPGDAPNEEQFWKTLITYFPPGTKKDVALLDLEGSKKKKRKTKRSVDRTDLPPSDRPKMQKADDSDHWLVEHLKGLFEQRTYKAVMEEDGTSIRYFVMEKYCEIAEREHSKNHIRFFVDLGAKQYTQVCPSPGCHGKWGITRDIPEKFHAEIDRYLKHERSKIRLASIFI